MSAIDTLFAKLRQENRKAFMPFVTAGDPDLDFTAAVIRELAARGSHLCEVGIPYSDPIADGPVIQASYTRALASGVRVDDILRMLGNLSSEVSMPLVTMVSYAIVYRKTPATYVRQAAEAGVAGLIVPDLPVEEAEELAAVCHEADVSLIQLVTPTTPHERAVRIAKQATGFIYYVSVAGTTGERNELPPDLLDSVAALRRETDLPICIGFGISKPEHIRRLAPVADGFIVGSAIVRRIAENAGRSRDEAIAAVGKFVGELVAATEAC
ncbi:MAG: tryptophan synthase subunit alpha [Planctomycetota bacterium]|nr:MAG: tryptophan synthase subunit alpha [Planctomycetota bacterium]